MKIHHVAYHHIPTGKLNNHGVIENHIFFLVTHGAFVYTINEQTVRVNKGEGLFIPQYSMRIGHTDVVPDTHHKLVVQFYNFPAQLLTPFLQDTYKLIRFDHSYNYVYQRFSILNECWKGRLPGYELTSLGILLEILGLTQQEMAGESHSPAHLKLARRAQQFIVKHYREPLKLEQIASSVDRSPAYVSTVFKSVVGKSPMEYMHEVRATAARELLLDGDLNVGEISDLLGYCNQTYFTHMYKKIIGQPPTETIKQYKQNKERQPI